MDILRGIYCFQGKNSFYEKRKRTLTPLQVYQFNKSFKYCYITIQKTILNSNQWHLPPLALLMTEFKLKYSLLHVLHINGALPHLLYPPFPVHYDGIGLTPSFVYFQLFLHSRGNHQVCNYGDDFGDHSRSPLNLFYLSLISRL